MRWQDGSYHSLGLLKSPLLFCHEDLKYSLFVIVESARCNNLSSLWRGWLGTALLNQYGFYRCVRPLNLFSAPFLNSRVRVLSESHKCVSNHLLIRPSQHNVINVDQCDFLWNVTMFQSSLNWIIIERMGVNIPWEQTLSVCYPFYMNANCFQSLFCLE